jgi:hypothetical protein
MQQEIGLTLRESRGGEMRAAEEITRVARKEKAVANRLQVLVEKANALEASNSTLIEQINDLRAERALVLAQVSPAARAPSALVPAAHRLNDPWLTVRCYCSQLPVLFALIAHRRLSPPHLCCPPLLSPLPSPQVKRASEKDVKMDEDMLFLSQAAHSALDQREKVTAWVFSKPCFAAHAHAMFCTLAVYALAVL